MGKNAVFAMNMNPAEGPGLIFQVLPATFNNIPGGLGWLWSGLFFLILAIAALTSGGLLLELAITYLHDEFKVRRNVAVPICTAVIALAGILPCVSVCDWSNIPWLHSALTGIFGEKAIPGNYFDLLDLFTSNWILPINGFFICIFVGWIWGTKKAVAELRCGTGEAEDSSIFLKLTGLSTDPVYSACRNRGLTVMLIWSILTRYVAPAIIVTIFLKALGAFA